MRSSHAVTFPQILKRLLIVTPFLLAAMAGHFLVVKHYYDAHIATGDIHFWTDRRGLAESSWSVFPLLVLSLLVWPLAAFAVIRTVLESRVPLPPKNLPPRSRAASPHSKNTPLPGTAGDDGRKK